MSKFTRFIGSNGQFYFNFKASNGEKVLTSEGYTTSSSRDNGIQSVRDNAPFDIRYDRRIARDNRDYFVLKAANGQIIGTSETYNSKQAMENAIALIKRDAPTAPVVEQN
ncbi:MAG: YegP family protein [Bacteroidetes bacterium]|nr:YegP family protein [Bacteroidota bacterium]